LSLDFQRASVIIDSLSGFRISGYAKDGMSLSHCLLSKVHHLGIICF